MPTSVVASPYGSCCMRGWTLYNLPINAVHRGIVMKAFVLACAAAIIIAAVAVVVLNGLQEPVQQAFSTSGVRL